MVLDDGHRTAGHVFERRPGFTRTTLIDQGRTDGSLQEDWMVARANERLAMPERVRRHACVAAFTQENGLLTATQKIRRAAVLRCHAGVTRP